MYYLLFDNAKVTEHNMLNQLAKQDKATICHIDQGLSHTSNAFYSNYLTDIHIIHKQKMIELSKIIKGIYDSTCVPHVDFVELSKDLIRTTGNNFKLIQHHCNYDLRKFNFTNRVIPI